MKRARRLLAGLLAAMLLATTLAPTALATGGRATGVTTETPATTEEPTGPARQLLF